MSDLPLDRIRSRAEVLCAMDEIMHHLNDECDIASWLMLGVPDGGPRLELTADQLEYYGAYAGDEDFEGMVERFATIVKLTCFSAKTGKYKKAGFC